MLKQVQHDGVGDYWRRRSIHPRLPPPRLDRASALLLVDPLLDGLKRILAIKDNLVLAVMRTSTALITVISVAAVAVLAWRNGEQSEPAALPVPVTQKAVSPSTTLSTEAERPRPSRSNVNDPPRDYVQDELTKNFAKWITNAPGAALPDIDVGDDQRRDMLAKIQLNASNYLIAWEKDSDDFAFNRAHLLIIQNCHLRSSEWLYVFDRRLRAEYAADKELSALRGMLSPMERDTADAFTTYKTYGYMDFQGGRCIDIGAQPRMARFDDYVRGRLISLRSKTTE